MEKKKTLELLKQLSSFIGDIKHEVALFYIILRKQGRSQKEIKDGLKINDPFSFFGDESVAKVFVFLFNDVQSLSEDDWDKLERFNTNIISKIPNHRSSGMIDALIHVVGSNNHGPTKYGLNIRLAKSLVDLLNIKEDAKVYNPFAGYASFGRAIESNTEYYGQEIDKTTWLIGQLHLINKGDKCKVLELEDSLTNWMSLDGESDIIIANPPYRTHAPEVMDTEFGRTSWMEEIAMYLGFKGLKENQQCLLLLPSGILFRSNKFTKNFREHIVESGSLTTVVKFPSGVISDSQIKLCAVILESPKYHSSHIRMIDLSDILTTGKNGFLKEIENISEIIYRDENVDFIRPVSIEKVRENDYNLDLPRYWLPESTGQNLFELSLGTSGTRLGLESKNRWEEKLPLVRIKDLCDDPISFEIHSNKLAKSSTFPSGGKLINKDSLLISTKFGNLKPTWINIQNEPVWISSNILSIDIDQDRIYIPYLIQELHSEKLKAQLKAYSFGQTIKSIRRSDLRRIKIELPDIEIQKARVASNRKIALQKEEEKLSQLKKEYGINEADSLSFLRHSLARNIKNANDVADDLTKIFDHITKGKLPEVYNMMGENDETLTLKQNLDILTRELIAAREVLRRASLDIDLNNKNDEKILLFNFVKTYTEELKTFNRKNFMVAFKYDELVLTKNIIQNLYINGDRRLLKRAFDNIIENALKHGFKNIPFEERFLMIELLYDENDDSVQIDFSNTGNPLPEDYSHSDFTRKGSRTGTNAGDGYGGFLIDKILKSHDGTIGFTDETGPEGIDDIYVTTFEATLPVELKF